MILIFCERIRRPELIEIFGDGQQTRDFVFVADVVTALLRAMDARLTAASAFNILTGRAASVMELARTVASRCGKTHRSAPGQRDRVRLGVPIVTRLRGGRCSD